MKTWKNWQIVLFVALCVCINVSGRLFAVWLQLPIWADSFGTALCAYIGGPICGAMVGLTGNLAYSVVNHFSAAYSITSITLGLIIGFAAKHKWFNQFYGYMKAASLAVLTALVVSVPLNLILDNGYTGNRWGNGVIDYLLGRKWPAFLCYILGQLALEFADKVLTISAVYIIYRIRRFQDSSNESKAVRQGTVAKTTLLLLISLGLSVLLPVRAEAA